MAALQDELSASLDECWTHVSGLFGALARRTELVGGASDADALDEIGAHYAALESLDKGFAAQLKRAAEHAANQRKLDALVAHIEARDASMRAGIGRLAALRDELYAMVVPAEKEIAALDAAEAEPMDYKSVLEYAQRLARYTSAPPGYRLGAAPDAPAEYNTAARAAGYYDPAIPGMAQELPFPPDMVMRQGILYEDAANMAGVRREEPGAPAPETMDTEDAPPQAAAPAPAALDAFGAADDDDEGLDLDLNP